MAVFQCRPLAACCLAFIVSILATYFLSVLAGMILFCAAIFVMLSLLLLTLIRHASYRKLYLFLLCFGIACGIGRTLYVRIATDRSLEAYIGQEITADLQVTEIRNTDSYTSTLTVKILRINGEEKSGSAIFYADYPTPFYPGDLFSGNFTAESLSYNTYYEGQAYSYRADGCSIVINSTNEESLVLLKSGDTTLLTALTSFRDTLAHTLCAYIDGEEGHLISALLLGKRDSLSDLTVRDFRRVGLSHLLALSGLHVSILTAVLDYFLRGIGMGKHLRIIVMFFFMLGFLIMTGCSFSMLRSVLMLFALYLAYFLEEEADPITSLSVAGALILCISPYAIFSASYQMTMLATFGILAFAPAREQICRFIPKKEGIIGVPFALLRGLLFSVLLTLSATLAILPIQWLTFGEFSVITPLANLLFVPLSAPLLVMGLLVLSAFPAELFAFCAQKTASLLLFGISELSRTQAVISLRSAFVPFVLLPLFAITFVLLLVDLGKRRALVFAPAVVSILAFAICLGIYNVANANLVDASYRVVGKNEGIVLQSTSGSVAIDLSNGSTTQMHNNWQLLQESGATELDILILTHYHKEHVISLKRFGQSVMIRALWVPEPTTLADFDVLADLVSSADHLGIPLYVYRRDHLLSLPGNLTLSVSAPLYMARSTQPAFSLTLRHNETGKQVAYASAALSEYRRYADLPPQNADCHYYILGSHGPIPHEEITVSTSEDYPTVICSGNDILRYIKIDPAGKYIYYPREDVFSFYFGT